MNRQVLVVAAHPDDEVLGCGATIARHAAAGDDVHIVIVAEGATSRDVCAADATASLRNAAHAAASLLGAQSVTFLGLPDNRLDTVPLLEVVKLIEAVVKDIAPSVVYTHHPSDLNVDHVVVHRATLTATRPMPGCGVEQLLLFEVPSSTGWDSRHPVFAPVWFVDATPWLNLKQEALAKYTTEIPPFPHARSHDAIEALARWRGSSVGVEAAEAFELQRLIMHVTSGDPR